LKNGEAESKKNEGKKKSPKRKQGKLAAVIKKFTKESRAAGTLENCYQEESHR